MASTESIVGSMARACLALFEPDQLWQRAREPLFWLGPTLKLVWVNQAWENLTGYSAESVIGPRCGCSRADPTAGPRPIWQRAFIPRRVADRPARGHALAHFPRQWRVDLAPHRFLAISR